MSEHLGSSDQQVAGSPEAGLDALQSTAAFRGPVEPLDGHEDTDHFALVYEGQTEQFSTAIPFVRQGLERDEHCLYIADAGARDDLVAALRADGVDVDAALETGQLAIHTVEEAYFAEGAFDADHARTFLQRAATAARDEYEGFRVVTDETWLVDDEAAQTAFMPCEAHMNALLEGTPGMALCQYDRTALSPDVIEEVIATHPYLIYDDVACPNEYYTPPEEYAGPDRQARENERKLETLVDRTDARAQLQARERYEREMYDITSDPDRSFEEKLHALFDLGCEWFDLDLGGLAKVDPETDLFEVEMVSADHDHLVPGARVDLSETYCRVVTNRRAGEGVDPVAVTDPIGAGFDGDLCYEQFGVQSYLGSYLEFDDISDRTFWFVSESAREDGFSGAERTFHHLMGQWVKQELERRQRERELRDRKERMSALVETTPDCIKTIAPDGTLLQMNRAGLEMVEADAESDVVGESVYDLVAPEDRDAFREFNEAVCDGARESLEYDIIGLAGTRRHMESHAAPLCRPDGTTVQVAVTRDVTEREAREAELRQTKNRFETVFEESDDAIFILDPDADELIDANPAAAEMTGYDREELPSMCPSDLHPDEMKSFQVFLDEVRANGSAWSEDFHCRHKDGRDVPAEISASAITLDGRDLVLALVRPIDDRKTHERYQRDLHEITADPTLSFEAKLERLLDLGRDRFDLDTGYITTIDDDTIEVVDAVGPDTGIEPGLTKPLDETYCEHLLDIDGPLAVSDPRDTDWDVPTPAGSPPLDAYLGTTIHVGGETYGSLCFGATSPRTEPFTQAERTFLELMGQWVGYELERREHKQAQRTLYEITADHDLSTDEKVQRILGLGRSYLDLSVGLINKDAGAHLEVQQMAGSNLVLDEGGPIPPSAGHYCEQVVETGTPVNVADAGAAGWGDNPLYDEVGIEAYAGVPVTVDGDVYGTLCFVDVAPRQSTFTEAEEAFLDLMGQCVSYELERQQHEQELKATIDQLQQSNDRLKQFAYAASHDLQEPLRMVSSYLQLLENRYRDDLDAEAQEYIDFAVDGADRMRAMVDDLLAFSRVEQADGDFEPVDGNALVGRVTDNLQVQIEENDADVVAESLPTPVGDTEQLEQLFGNLVSNAIKYNESETPRVEITADERGDYWEFAVSDNGIGIDPDKTDRIFEVFKRLHHDDAYVGTGIGLSLCQEIVENHGGDIRVESDPGNGSTFYVTLPRTTEER